MKKKLPYMPFYPEDFLGYTSDMTPEEIGIFISLYCHLWINGGWLKSDVTILKRMLKISRIKLEKVLTIFEKHITRTGENGELFTIEYLLLNYEKTENKVNNWSKNGEVGREKAKQNRENRLASERAKTSTFAPTEMQLPGPRPIQEFVPSFVRPTNLT